MPSLTPFARVVATSEAVAATSKRTEKRAALATLLAELDPSEVEATVGFLTGEARQGRIGVGWATVADVPATEADEMPDASGPGIGDVDALLADLAATSGPGSQERRRSLLTEMRRRASDAEFAFIGRLLVGELRQGANAGAMVDAVAVASGIPLAAVRRAVMLRGDLGAVARLALVDGVDAVRAVRLVPGRPILPMLASTAASVAEATEAIGGEVQVEWKLDGVRIQVHRCDDEVLIVTRNLNDVTPRLPGVVAIVRSFPAQTFVLDGELLGAGSGEERPDAFQDTMSRFGTDDLDPGHRALEPHFFDLLHLDGLDLVDEPLRERRARLEALVGERAVPGTCTRDPAEAEAVNAEALAAGHEGVMVKDAAGGYDAGRRGKGWRKVKPVHTLDLVVLAAEWGHGRRTGWLSNLHLGARDPDAPGRFVMVGKTFKGLTDELLRWQTEALQSISVHEDGHVVGVRPELVVEIALDGVQRSTRYPGGVALRFARVRGYRDDKSAADADTIDTVREHLVRP